MQTKAGSLSLKKHTYYYTFKMIKIYSVIMLL